MLYKTFLSSKNQRRFYIWEALVYGMEKLLLRKDDLNEEADYEEEDDEFLDNFSNDEN